MICPRTQSPCVIPGCDGKNFQCTLKPGHMISNNSSARIMAGININEVLNALSTKLRNRLAEKGKLDDVDIFYCTLEIKEEFGIN